jgi:predicted nucleic acid-binding protein
VRPGEKAAGEKLKEIAQLPIDLVGVDMELAELAATPMAEHNLPYADYFAAALARLGKAMLVTADRDFAIVKEILGIVWPFQAFPLTVVIQSDIGLL